MKSYFFEFDGKKSYDMGFMNVRISKSEAKRKLVGKQKINVAENIRYRKNFIQSTQRDPIIFTLRITPNDGEEWTDELLERLVKWLSTEDYRPFVSGDNPALVCYAKCTSDFTWQGLYDYGTIELEFETNANTYFTKPAYVTYQVTGSQDITINNKSVTNDINYPLIEITKTNATGSIEIINHTDNERLTSISQLNKGEKLGLDNEFHLIQSKTPFNFYGERFNKKWFRLLPDVNHITVKGDCEIAFRLQFEAV